MVTIRLHNSKTRAKEVFEPINRDDVRMYVCGPTVYDRAHIGNARPVVVFDTLFRLLRHVYGADHVTYVRNFTDVDDKINATAQARKAAGAPGTLEDLIRARTEETIGWYHADMDALGAMRPESGPRRDLNCEPRATAYIEQMKEMIHDLIAGGHAYEAEGHVLFDVRSYPQYGQLSGRSVDDMIAGARVEVAPYKRDPMDFVLWKPSDESLPGWESDWGRGRPGWHIECSAMAKQLLGETFDIHGGGIDLQFPHHENEIAQSCCANHSGKFANFWLHNEMLQVEGKKMSKSLGNFFTVRDLLDQRYPGEVIRYVYLGTHYSKPMDWTRRKAHDANIALEKMAGMLGMKGTKAFAELKPGQPLPWVVEALADDLNTSLACSELGKGNLRKRMSIPEMLDRLEDIYASQLLLGFDFKSEGSAFRRFAVATAEQHDERLGGIQSIVPRSDEDLLLAPYADRLAALRAEAMASKNFSAVDAMKAALTAAGVEVRMSKAGVELLPAAGFDAAKLPVLE